MDAAALTHRRARWVRRGADLLLFWGVLAALVGVLYAINGATQGGATIKVQVAVPVPAEQGAGWGNRSVELEGVEPAGGWLAPARQAGVLGAVGMDGRLTFAAPDSTRVEQALARGDAALLGLGLLAGALALRPVLRTIADGRPFERGNARRLVTVSATVAVTALVAPALPQVATGMVLARTGLVDDLGTWYTWPVGALVVAALVLVLAAAFRSGERMSNDLEGLV